MDNKNDELLAMLESTANLIRGMQFDLRIPSDARWVLVKRSKEIDSLVDKHLNEHDDI